LVRRGPDGSTGSGDLDKARRRATRNHRRPEVHGQVVAELSLGFWRYLVASRYLTSIWIPAAHRAFPFGPDDLRERRAAVEQHLQELLFVRNRAAHHEPVHRRDLGKDLAAAIELISWISPDAAAWIAAVSPIPQLVRDHPLA